MKDDKRIHGTDMDGAGDLGPVPSGELFGPCPSCAAELRVTVLRNPNTGREGRALMHPAPFCTYYGETSPEQIERDVEAVRSKS